MLIFETRAVAIGAISTIAEIEGGYEIELLSGSRFPVIGEDAAEFNNQMSTIASGIRQAQMKAKGGLIL